ncbi:xanthine/uracil permease [Anaeramoeba ignava]|uniref:Xanthine/uracil permease n=1 Tax=Anaeramoeba ignava TaxID=1746090 RepID=A0A9Q0LBP6_ANAIG|nr:xanthine/uracil permease [Anaeramoeba ignava]
MFFTTIYILREQPNALPKSMDRLSIIWATCLVSGFGSIALGIFSGFPLVLSMAIGENEYFTQILCHYLGYSWETALSIHFFEGIVCFIAAFLIPKSNFISALPSSFRIGLSYGIGLFLGKLGLVDVLHLDSSYVFKPSYEALLGILTLVLVVFGVSRKYRWIFVISVLVCTIFSIIIRASIDDLNMEIWKFPNLSKSAFKLNFHWRNASPLYFIIFLALENLFNVVCTILTVIQFAFLDKIRFDVNGFEKLISSSNTNKFRNILLVNGFFVIVGSLLGTTPNVVYIESSVAAAVGARTGLASVITGLLFLLSALFYPIILLIPPEATGSLLLYTNILIFTMLKFMEFDNIIEIIPVIVSTILIPIFANITKGVSFGYLVLLISFIFGKKKWRQVSFSMIVLGIISASQVFIPEYWFS